MKKKFVPKLYCATISTQNKVEIKNFVAFKRSQAVHQAELWFWKEYSGSQGPAHKAIIVDDPYREVVYGPKFICSHRKNKLLPADVVNRVIAESHGELIRDEREGRPHYPPNSVRRVKRRRDFGIYIAPAIKKMKNGSLYYHLNVISEITHGGDVIKKHKYRDIRLKARTIVGAIDEIKERKLHEQNALCSGRNMKVRDLVFVGHIAGSVCNSILTDEQKQKFSRVMNRYREKFSA